VVLAPSGYTAQLQGAGDPRQPQGRIALINAAINARSCPGSNLRGKAITQTMTNIMSQVITVKLDSVK